METVIRERPILMSTPMVNAILTGAKTQTRRIIRFPKHADQPDTKWIESVNPDGAGGWIAWGPHGVTDEFSMRAYPTGGGFKCPLGVSGDRLWVRETFAVQQFLWERNHEPQPIHYPATSQREEIEDYTYKPSIHMPRWASRITLEVTDVRVERVQSISHVDALSEGVPADAELNDYGTGSIYRDEFARLWDNIYAKRGWGWNTNPWVWVIEFQRVQSPPHHNHTTNARPTSRGKEHHEHIRDFASTAESRKRMDYRIQFPQDRQEIRAR